MSWVAEGVLNKNQPWQNWKPKFFALRGSDVCIFDAPPVSIQILPMDTEYQNMKMIMKNYINRQCIIIARCFA